MLVIADGSLNDLDETIEQLILLADQPCSVVIVGVGSADFSDMNVLDGDKNRISAGGKSASRDLVSFVNFRKITEKGRTVYDLANALLGEIPDQLLQFMEKKNLTPNAIARSECEVR